MSRFATFQRVRARKDHTCECCNYRFTGEVACFIGTRPRFSSRKCIIKRGDLHEVQSGFHDGGPYRFRLCLFHAAVCQAIFKEEREVNFDWLKEYVEIGTVDDWRKWLPLIRSEYRRLKATAKVEAA